MSVSENLKLSVAQGNIGDIRIFLCSCIPFDRNMTGSFKESLDYVLSNGISESELFEADKDVGEYSTEPSNENFSELGGLFLINFSKEKLEALRKIGCALYPPEEDKTKKTPSSVRSNSTQSGRKTAPSQTGTVSRNQNKRQEGTVLYAAGGAIAGAGVGAVAAVGFGAKIGGILGFGIIGACIGGFIGYTFAKSSS